MDDSQAFLRDLTEAPGLSGHEGPVRDVLARRLESVCTVAGDGLGSYLGRVGGREADPRVMLSAHMDEVGFMVKRITDRGCLRIGTIGGWWPQRLIGQQVTVLARQGPIPGLLECKSEMRMTQDERAKVVPVEELFVDIGASSQEQVQSWGIRPGTPIVPATRFTVMADESLYLAKAWDDRAGCGVAAEAALALADRHLPNTVFVAGTVQEEVGARGAQTAGAAIKPDVALILEIGVATDMPGLSSDTIAPLEVGKGPAITVYDSSMLPNNHLLELLMKVAEDEGIPYQCSFVSSGGTDGSRIHLLETGVPCVVICVPARFIHSMAGIIHRADYDATVRLVVAAVARLDKAAVRALAPA